MKKLLAALVAIVAINASAYDITNTVTIVSNIYNRISREYWITNNVKNTHANYYYTNNVYTVSNVTLLVSQTNVNTTETYDIGRSMLSIMSNDVNSAKASIRSTADEAAGSATSASAAASRASSSAASAQNTLGSVNSRGAEIINAMNAKQDWFDENFGKMVTVIQTNIYNASAVEYDPKAPKMIDVFCIENGEVIFLCTFETKEWIFLQQDLLGSKDGGITWQKIGVQYAWRSNLDIIQGELPAQLSLRGYDSHIGRCPEIFLNNYTDGRQPAMETYFSVGIWNSTPGYAGEVMLRQSLSGYSPSTFRDAANPIIHGLPNILTPVSQLITLPGIRHIRLFVKSHDEYQEIRGDLTIRNRAEDIIGKLATEDLIHSLSNWVEQTFMKK